MEAWRCATQSAGVACTLSLHCVAVLNTMQPTDEILAVIQMPGTCQR